MKKVILILAMAISTSCVSYKPAFDREPALMMTAIVYEVNGNIITLKFTSANDPEIVAFDKFEAQAGHSYKKHDVLRFEKVGRD
jgi:hypothetical protein